MTSPYGMGFLLPWDLGVKRKHIDSRYRDRDRKTQRQTETETEAMLPFII